jgi:hypothetical protein
MADPVKPQTGFVSLRSVAKGAPDPATALADIRRIYFKTTRQTIEHDFAHAIELLKALPDEEQRSKAHVFMEGLAEMRRDWTKTNTTSNRTSKKPRSPTG